MPGTRSNRSKSAKSGPKVGQRRLFQKKQKNTWLANCAPKNDLNKAKLSSHVICCPFFKLTLADFGANFGRLWWLERMFRTKLVNIRICYHRVQGQNENQSFTRRSCVIWFEGIWQATVILAHGVRGRWGPSQRSWHHFALSGYGCRKFQKTQILLLSRML